LHFGSLAAWLSAAATCFCLLLAEPVDASLGRHSLGTHFCFWSCCRLLLVAGILQSLGVCAASGVFGLVWPGASVTGGLQHSTVNLNTARKKKKKKKKKKTKKPTNNPKKKKKKKKKKTTTHPPNTPYTNSYAGVRIMLSNTYHLGARPGPDLLRDAGGLHTFMSYVGFF
jgi:hypothetical protein